MVLIKKFYCCLGLQTGGVIIGWLYVILGIISLVCGEFHNIFLICMGFIGMSSGASLIWGAYKKRKLFIIPWLVTSILGIIFGSIMLVMETYIIIYYEASSTAIIGVDIIVIGLAIYTWLCIVSLYQKFRLKDLQNNQQYVVFSAIAPVEDTAAARQMEEKPPAYNEV